VDKLEELTD